MAVIVKLSIIQRNNLYRCSSNKHLKLLSICNTEMFALKLISEKYTYTHKRKKYYNLGSTQANGRTEETIRINRKKVFKLITFTPKFAMNSPVNWNYVNQEIVGWHVLLSKYCGQAISQTNQITISWDESNHNII